MIELAFGDSFAGGLKMAKSMEQGTQLNGPMAVGIIGGTRKERREARKKIQKPQVWTGKTIEGCSGDIAVLSLLPNIGDISDMDSSMNARKKLFDTFFEDFPGAADEMWQANQQTLIRLQNAKETKEPIRMWLCHGEPGELCSLYFVCYLMADSQVPLSVVRIPEEIMQDNSIINYRGLGEIKPELLGEYIKYEEPINDLQRNIYANNWSCLMQENAPLRAIVNGNIMGVPEYFYDFALRANMTDEEMRIGQLIGNTLSQLSGVGDRQLLLRVQAMLQSGELIMVSEAKKNEPPYSAVVTKRQM